MLLDRKVILVTGTSRGIGKATVLKCLAEGATVVANYRSNISFDDYSEAIISEKQLHFIKADVRFATAVMLMMEKIKDDFGQLDGIVNNAGVITRTSDWKNIEGSDWEYNLETNVIGTWNVIRFGVDLMPKGGSIVNISSIYGSFPEANELSYSVSKAGVNALTIALAKKLSPNIRVNAVMPGNTLTSMVPDEEGVSAIEKKTLLQRSAQPCEIANTIAYLLSDQSSYITGSLYAADGGYHVL